jgi:superfamily II DNA or RNA helicase
VEAVESSAPKYTIVYSNNISIFEGKQKIDEVAFGDFHTQEFINKRKEYSENGGIKEIADFYKEQKLFEKPREPKIPAWPFQKVMVQKAANKGIYSGIFESPTGSGKTNTIACCIAEINLSAIIIVPTADLVKQTKDRIVSVLGIEDNDGEKIVGALGGGQKELNRPVLVCTWHSLQNEITLSTILAYGYNILFSDETHRASANLLSQYIGMFKSRKKLGFTASAYRSRDEQMRKINSLVGPIIHSVDVKILYKEGFIIQPEIYRFKLPYSANTESATKMHYEQALRKKRGMRWVMANALFTLPAFKLLRPVKNINDLIYNPDENDYKLMSQVAIYTRNQSLSEKKKEFACLPEEERAEKLEELNSIQLGLAKKGIDSFIPRLEHIISLAVSVLNKEDEAAAILFNSISAGKYVADALLAAGYDNVVLINGGVDDKAERLSAIVEGRNKNYIAISTIQMLSEGTDAPTLRNIIVASPIYPPYTSIERGQQIIGRVVRRDFSNPNKIPRAYVVDDMFSDGVIASKSTLMWGYIDNAFQAKQTIINHDEIVGYKKPEDLFVWTNEQNNIEGQVTL